jgi:hypothetical protein
MGVTDSSACCAGRETRRTDETSSLRAIGTLTVLLALGATYRISRLLVVDEFPPIAKARQWVTERFGDDSAVSYLAACMWCASCYVGAVVAYSAYLWGSSLWWQAVMLAACSSAVAGLISSWEPE